MLIGDNGVFVFVKQRGFHTDQIHRRGELVDHAAFDNEQLPAQFVIIHIILLNIQQGDVGQLILVGNQIFIGWPLGLFGRVIGNWRRVSVSLSCAPAQGVHKIHHATGGQQQKDRQHSQ